MTPVNLAVCHQVAHLLNLLFASFDIAGSVHFIRNGIAALRKNDCFSFQFCRGGRVRSIAVDIHGINPIGLN